MYFFYRFIDIDLGANAVNSSVLQHNELSKTTDFSKSTSGWINTVPLSNSTATLSRKSAKSRRVPMADNFVKSYLKKRNLILDLLVSENVKIQLIIIYMILDLTLFLEAHLLLLTMFCSFNLYTF